VQVTTSLLPEQLQFSPVRGSAHAADDAAAIYNAAISAYGTAAASGDPAKMAAVYAPDGELVSP
jgi:hypothetical protein